MSLDIHRPNGTIIPSAQVYGNADRRANFVTGITVPVGLLVGEGAREGWSKRRCGSPIVSSLIVLRPRPFADYTSR